MVENMGNRRWWAAAALALSGVVIGIDATVLSLALPTLATDLHASTAQLQWFVDAYLLVLGAMMLPAGLLGDRFGRKRLLLGALSLFGLGSLAETDEAPAELHDLALRRAEARGGGDFDSADRIRAEIEEAGWDVRDVAGDPGYQLVPRR